MRKWLPVMVLMLVLPLALQASEGAVATDMTQRLAVLVVQLGVLLFAAKAGGLCFCRIGLPGFLGELTVGMVIGPFLLGSLPVPGFSTGVFPAGQGFPVSPELYGLCSVASVLLLFVAGLGTDARMFLRYSVTGTAVGIGGAVASFLVGDLAGVLFGAAVFGQSLGFMDAPCLFLGVVSTATSVGVSGRILAERRRLDTPEGVTTLAASAVDGVLGVVAFAGVLGVVSASGVGGVDWGHFGVIAARAFGVLLLVALAGVLVVRRLGSLLSRWRGRTSLAIMSLGLAMVLAGVFEAAGLAMVIGAYALGLMLSRTELAPVIRGKLDPLYALLAPVFFAVMGMLVDMRSLGDARVLGFGLLYTGLAVVAKLIGCGAPAVLFGFNLRGALRVGMGMMPRGEIALVVAGVGLVTGALPREIYTIVILMVVLTTVSAPAVLWALFRSRNSGVGHGELRVTADAICFPCSSLRQAEWIFNGLQDTLRRDGFFVHVLEHEGGAVLALRERTSIAFRHDNTDILFTCEPSAVPVVKTAVLYVVGE